MSLRIRGQEQTLQVIVEGQDQTGTFLNVDDWKVTPKVDITETDFVGQDETDLDVQYHGVGFSFTVEEQDSKARQFFDDLMARQRNRERPSKVIIIVHNEYRDSSDPGNNLVITNAVMKPDEFGNQGRKNYSKVPFTGAGKIASVVDE
jgi:hypothetical protein